MLEYLRRKKATVKAKGIQVENVYDKSQRKKNIGSTDTASRLMIQILSIVPIFEYKNFSASKVKEILKSDKLSFLHNGLSCRDC